MTITYTAYVSGKVFSSSTDYDALKAKMDKYLNDYAAKHQVWLGGFIQSFR